MEARTDGWGSEKWCARERGGAGQSRIRNSSAPADDCVAVPEALAQSLKARTNFEPANTYFAKLANK